MGFELRCRLAGNADAQGRLNANAAEPALGGKRLDEAIGAPRYATACARNRNTDPMNPISRLSNLIRARDRPLISEQDRLMRGREP